MVNPKGFLNEAASLIDDRGADYGGIEQNFELIASLANNIIGLDLNAREVAMILHCVKLARLRTSPAKRDNYLDGVNYLAFAGELAQRQIRGSADDPMARGAPDFESSGVSAARGAPKDF